MAKECIGCPLGRDSYGNCCQEDFDPTIDEFISACDGLTDKEFKDIVAHITEKGE